MPDGGIRPREGREASGEHARRGRRRGRRGGRGGRRARAALSPRDATWGKLKAPLAPGAAIASHTTHQPRAPLWALALAPASPCPCEKEGGRKERKRERMC
uniref:Uncharacterized protein n=1 Tax=Oryza sativa subsp. indica TaxID=39946 RepID=A0A8F2VW42_ORYSI|nr:hypothetical protein Xa7_IRBB7.50 [Oryza sativa Indica Group]